MLTRFTRLSVFCLILSLTPLGSAAPHLLIVGDHDAKPKNWLDNHGQAQGIMIDLLNEVSKRTAIQFSYELMPWKRALIKSKSGDAAIIGFSKTTERKALWHYSEPMYFDPLVIVTTQAKSFDFEGLSSLRGKRLAIKLGATYGDDFYQAKSRGEINVIETPNRASQLQMLAYGRVDCVLVSPGKIALYSAIAQNKWLIEHRHKFVVLDPPLKLDPNYLGLPKSMNNEAILITINSALADIHKEGLYDKIVKKNTQLVLNEFDTVLKN